jgi:hypothetical protein
VDFPAPLAPTMASSLPGFAVKESRSKAGPSLPGYVKLTLSNSTMPWLRATGRCANRHAFPALPGGSQPPDYAGAVACVVWVVRGQDVVPCLPRCVASKTTASRLKATGP